MTEQQFNGFKDELEKIAAKKKIFDEEAKKDLTSGAIGGGVSALIMNPVDVINTAQQREGTSAWKTVKNLYQSKKGGGIKAFYRGTSTKVLKVAPATAISYAVMMKARSMMGDNVKK